MTNKTPFTIELTDNTPLPHPAEVDPILDAPVDRHIHIQRTRGLGLFGWILSVGAMLISSYFAIQFWNFVFAQIASNTTLGAIMGAMAILFIVLVFAFILREIFGILRMQNMDRLRMRIDAVLAEPNVTETKRILGELNRVYARHNHLKVAIENQVITAKESVDVHEMFSRYETDVVATLDSAALKEVERAARQVATVTAMVPVPWIDMLAALSANIRMIRRIGEIYGGHSGPIGSWRLLRAVSAHLMATGALAVGDDWLGSVFGGSLLSRLSRRFGEGMVNAALTARVGRAAIEVCRPLPYHMQPRPKICSILRRALTNIFDKSPD